MEDVIVSQEHILKLRKTIHTIDWLPLEKEPGVERSYEEYYSKNCGNVVVGCEDNGVYLYHVLNE